MEWQELLRDLIDLVESTAPHVWEITVRQIYVHCVQWLFSSIVCGILGFILYRSGSMCWIKHREDKDEMFDFLAVVSWIFSFICFIWLAISLSNMIGRLINPEYYAIELLINYIK